MGLIVIFLQLQILCFQYKVKHLMFNFALCLPKKKFQLGFCIIKNFRSRVGEVVL